MVIDSSSPPAHDGGPVEAATKDAFIAEGAKVLQEEQRQEVRDAPVPLRNEPNLVDSSGVVTTTVITMQDASAFIATLPDKDKEAYVAAILQDAELVKRESDLALYLRRHSDSLPDAARAMALYWTERRSAFSDERFALPMDRTGEGAMSAQDVKAVESGAVARLPNDREGRAVLWFDLFKLQGVSGETRTRACFYLLHGASGDAAAAAAAAKGYAIVCFMDSSHGPLLTELPIKTMQGVLATPPSAIHIVLRVQGSGPSSDDMLETLEPSLAQVADGDLEDRLFFHVCKDGRKGPPASLLAAGFQARDLPACVGGTQLSSRKNPNGDDPGSPSPKRHKSEAANETKSAKKTSSESHKPPFASLSRSSKKKLNARKGMGPNRDAEINAAATALAEDDRRAYAEAKKTVPHLVKKETDPMEFLVVAQNDVNKAAARLVEHWKKRKDLFGSRAFHPLTQTGEGALNRPDLTALSTGVFLVLPLDAQGRAVLYFDCAKIGDSTRDSLRRLAFYMLSVACEVSASPDRGIVVLMSLQDSTDSSHFKVGFRDILEAMPGQVAAYHVVCFQALQQNPNIPQEQLGAVAEAYFGPVPGSKRFVHMDRTRSQALDRLRMHGLSPHSLPRSIGGSWGVERFVEWCELRTRYEWGLPPAASHKGVEKVFDFSHIKPPSLLDDEDRIERARRMNVLHSRRKRERERIEIEVLHEQCDEMRSLKSELIHERSRLQALITTAQSIVANPSPNGGYGALLENSASASQDADPTTTRQFVSVSAPAFVSNDSNSNFRQNQQQQNHHQQQIQQQQRDGVVSQPENAAYFTQGHYFTNASGQVVVPQGQAFVHQGQTFVQQNQGNGSQGTFVMAPSAATQPYCLVPSSASGMQATATGYTMQQVPAQGMQQQHMQGVPQQQFVPVVEVQYQQASTPYFMQVNGGPTPAGFVQSPGPVSVGFVQAPGPAPVGFVQPQGMTYSVPVPVMTTSAPDFGPYYTATTGESTAGAPPTMMSDESSRSNAAPSDALVQTFP